MNKAAIVVSTFFFAHSLFGQLPKYVVDDFKTPHGEILLIDEYREKGTLDSGYYLSFKDKILLKPKNREGRLVPMECIDLQSPPNDENQFIRILFREIFPPGGDAGWERYYIVDCTGSTPVVSPGFDNGNTYKIQHIKWEKDKTTVYFKNNGKVFVWENFTLKEIPRTQPVKQKK